MRLTHVNKLNEPVTQTLKSALRLGLAEAPKYINQVRGALQPLLYKKASELNNWYTKLLGLDEVRQYQERVISIEEKLLKAQEHRRKIGVKLADVRQKSNDLQDQIHKINRQADLQRFLDFMKEEAEISKRERDISAAFSESDRTERELFTAFINAVRESHEKQRSQVEYTKYFGIVLSLVGSFLTFCYSALKKNDLKKCIEENFAGITQSSLPLLSQLQRSQQQLSRVMQYIDQENPRIVEVINIQHELLKALQNSSAREATQSAFQIVPTGRSEHVATVQKIAAFSLAALAGIVVLRAFS